MAAKKDADLRNNSKPLHEVIDMIYVFAKLQTKGVDVAIPYLQGNPGGGKTSSIYSRFKQANWKVVSTHFALKVVEELGGIPNFKDIYVNGEKVTATDWSFPDIMSSLCLMSDECYVEEKGGVKTRWKSTGRVSNAFVGGLPKDFVLDPGEEVVEVKGDGKERGVFWLLDDMHLCGPTHMSLLYELLTERKLRDYTMPKNVAIGLAGNTSQKAGAKTTFSAIVNRCAMQPVYSDFEAWKNNFALKNGVHPAIVSFLSMDPNRGLFHEEEQVDKPWASPRSWTRLANFLTEMEETVGTVAMDDMMYICESHIGNVAGSKFVQYHKIYDNFDMKKVFKEMGADTHEKYKMPTEEKDGDSVKHYAFAFASVMEYSSITPEEAKKAEFKNYPLAMARIINRYSNRADNSEVTMVMFKDLKAIQDATNRQTLKAVLEHLMKINPRLVPKITETLMAVQ